MPKLKTASTEPKTAGDLRNSNTMAMLYGFVERYERLQEERDGLGEDQKEIMGEAKGLGFDTTILKRAIQRRKKNAADVMDADATLELYEEVLREQEKKQLAQSQADAQ